MLADDKAVEVGGDARRESLLQGKRRALIGS